MSNEALINELTPLLEALCEDRMTPEGSARLQQLVLGSQDARWYYITYIDLHGSLYWDAAGVGSAEALSSDAIPSFSLATVKESSANVSPALVPAKRSGPMGEVFTWIGMAACACIVAAIAWTNMNRPAGPVDLAKNSETNPSTAKSSQADATPVRRHHGPEINIATSTGANGNGNTTASGSNVVAPVNSVARVTPQVPAPPAPHHEDLDSHEVVAAINTEIHRGWDVSGIRPSALADDSEWLRRVSLDLIGRIPTVEEAEAFLSSKRPNKRTELVDRLLDDTAYARNFTTVWTNLLVGRRSEQKVNRPALQKFLRMAFAGNRPWNQIVYDLIAAEGNNAENGATNFLIAHLNNDALPATAVTARVFLGEQIQCNQCHNNPFTKSSQSAFWELHSFFSQTACVPRQAVDPQTGKPQYSYTELVTQTAGGPAYFESLTGVMRVAFPQYNGQSVDPSPETNRRATLARLLTEGDQQQLAQAFVNRLWGHFFGEAFTHVIDDMGPHNPPSHPELLELLSRQFVRSGYDTKQLIRWICNSEPYQLSSRFGPDNRDDDPVEGQLPRFSRMYVKSMTPEQMYDSFVIATKAHRAGGVDWEQAESQRQQWLSQFVVDYATDENDEAMELDGNLVQALTLMNGGLVEKAMETSPGTFLGEVVRRRTDEKEKIRELCLAVLSRAPTPTELTNMRKLVRQDANMIASHGGSRSSAETEGYQDLFWALLNSNEFSTVH